MNLIKAMLKGLAVILTIIAFTVLILLLASWSEIAALVFIGIIVFIVATIGFYQN